MRDIERGRKREKERDHAGHVRMVVNDLLSKSCAKNVLVMCPKHGILFGSRYKSETFNVKVCVNLMTHKII